MQSHTYIQMFYHFQVIKNIFWKSPLSRSLNLQHFYCRWPPLNYFEAKGWGLVVTRPHKTELRCNFSLTCDAFFISVLLAVLWPVTTQQNHKNMSRVDLFPFFPGENLTQVDEVSGLVSQADEVSFKRIPNLSSVSLETPALVVQSSWRREMRCEARLSDVRWHLIPATLATYNSKVKLNIGANAKCSSVIMHNDENVNCI